MGTGPGLPVDTCCLAPGQGVPQEGRSGAASCNLAAPLPVRANPAAIQAQVEVLGPSNSWAGWVQAGPCGCIQSWGLQSTKAEESCSLLSCCPLSDHAVLAVCKAVYYQHVNNLSQCLISWKGNRSCGPSLKSMPSSLALGRDFCFFLFHSHNKYVTTDPASKGNTYL